ncbi:sugar ABC transporter ATP-binding protein [Clostridium estertheticum]|uniref:Sugar ABC transporter ATP-binding protein n=1 Tax=Clostridium estertheticum TaxID=238834 RepID=A0A5N7ISF6_9CLOT|nr:sugar ABC transporter ATP-binding protein [Clostridium estertheticum]MPQ33250.1 sugar ABC transporter ATP-binding protein [Clostridium estertheticum]MPQ63908.1 sugar ABC transporter ATP-binding protein [Clostridium estertheticum]
MEEKIPFLEMKGISKCFPGVKALDNINLSLYKGEVLALLGENGAGKSTLIKILGGVYQKDDGKVVIQGSEVDIKNVKEAEKLGISIIHQELSVIPNLTVAENLFLGNEKINKVTKKLDKKTMNTMCKDYLKQIGSNVDPEEYVKNISIGEMQMLEIVKAISKNSNIIVMDEPTSALTDTETEKLFKVVEMLKSRNIAIIYISHRLDEIFAICDRINILRDGKYVGEVKVNDVSKDDLITMMVGRKMEEQYPYKEPTNVTPILKLNDVCLEGILKSINLEVRAGEILGMSGLMGSGRSEVAKVIFGEYKRTSGSIEMNGKQVNINCPKDAINSGIAYLSEDRKKEGLILPLSVKQNMTLASLDKFEKKMFCISKADEKNVVDEYIKKLAIKTPTQDQLIKNLSGGNQQKVIIAKWLIQSPKVLIIDEPTRGIDVGAKKEIYDVLNQLKAEGKAVIMISSDMSEVLGISDRIVVMHEGKITGELSRQEATQESIMKLAIGE